MINFKFFIFNICKIDFFIVVTSILPFWFFYNYNFLNYKILLFFLFLILLIVFFLKKKIFYNFILSFLILYSFDSKIGFLNLFKFILKNQNQIILYLISIILIIFLFLSIYCLIAKYKKAKIFFLSSMLFLFSYNVITNFLFELKNYELENLTIKKSELNNKSKIFILHLDELIGPAGIDSGLFLGKEAKEKYNNFFKKYDFKVYNSAYSIYNSTIYSIPNLLNFDYQTNQNNYLNYSEITPADKNSLWRVKKNRFFEINKNKKILASKGHVNYCDSNIYKCLFSNPVNYYKKYNKNFKFNFIDYVIEKTHNQGSILFQFIWRIGRKYQLINDNHYLVFNKAKIENDFNNLAILLNNTEFEIYFVHLLFPHRPFSFEINDNRNLECHFDNKKVKNMNLDTKNTSEILIQHNKEVICTINILDNFFQKINKNVFNNLKILILSDTGINVQNNPSNQEQFSSQKFMRSAHSVLFALKDFNGNFEVSNEFISSQELFSNIFNNKHNKRENNLKIFKVYDDNLKKFVQIFKF